MTRFAIIGAGNAGCTLAAHLKLLGHHVALYDVVQEQLTAIIENSNTVNLTGNIDIRGPATMDVVTLELAEAVRGAELIICTTPAHVHKFVARDLAPVLKPGQIVVLNPGRTGGVLEVRRVLAHQGFRADVLVVETQTTLHACRRDAATVRVFGVKQHNSCSGLPKDAMGRFFDLIQPVLPQFVSAPHGIWNTSLDNIGMLFHPAPTLMNLGRMESRQPFDYYIDGISPSIAYLVEQLDAERLQVAAALGQNLPTAVEWLRINYGAVGKGLYEALQNNTSYRGIKAPVLGDIDAKRSLRYVIEDVPTGLVPVSELGRRFAVATPTMDTVIDLANTLFDADFRTTGRNLEQLGLAEMTPDEIRAL